MTADVPATAPGVLDAAAWVRRWNRQQATYVPEREETFELMLDIVGRLVPDPERVVDLGCGPGSLAAEMSARWPRAEVIGVDLDPVLLELGRRTLSDRVRWCERDLRSPHWSRDFVESPVDAVASATALHWLAPEQLRHLAENIAAVLRPGGVFLDYDTMLLGPEVPGLATVSQHLRGRLHESAAADSHADSWDGWWEELRQEPELADHFVERTRRFGNRRHASGTTLGKFVTALRNAGFQEVAPLKQIANRHLLAAIR